MCCCLFFSPPYLCTFIVRWALKTNNQISITVTKLHKLVWITYRQKKTCSVNTQRKVQTYDFSQRFPLDNVSLGLYGEMTVAVWRSAGGLNQWKPLMGEPWHSEHKLTNKQFCKGHPVMYIPWKLFFRSWLSSLSFHYVKCLYNWCTVPEHWLLRSWIRQFCLVCHWFQNSFGDSQTC